MHMHVCLYMCIMRSALTTQPSLQLQLSFMFSGFLLC